MPESMRMANRFRGFLPVVVDVETGGFNETTDALLQIAAVLIDIDERGDLYCSETVSCHVNPFPGANLEPKSMEVNGIDVHHPFRLAVDEKQALPKIFKPVHARGPRLRSDGARTGCAIGRHGMGYQGSSFGDLRRGDDGDAILQDRQ